MAYTVLPAELWELADEVAKFYSAQWGITGGRVRKETHLPGPDLGFVPTLYAEGRDHHLVCVEVASTPYHPPLDRFVLACRNNEMPVKLYVAVPEDSAPTFRTDLRSARENGVGVLESAPRGIEIVHEAQSQSLVNVRPPDLDSFPAALREPLSQALRTFKNGDPAKGCLNVYEELEALTRIVVSRTQKRKAWRRLKGGQREPNLGNTDKGNWQPLTRKLLDHLDPMKLNRPRLDEALLSRVIGITTHRNMTGHKPKTVSALRNRDRRLRTRFEEACDLLEEFADAARKP